MERVAKRLMEEYPEDASHEGAFLRDLQDAEAGQVRPTLYCCWELREWCS